MTLPTSGSTEAMIVRDKMLTRIQAMSFFSAGGFKYSTDKAKVIDPADIPFVGVYLISEDLTPDEDINAGEVRFRSSALYGFSVIVQNNDNKVAEYTIDKAYQLITVGLFQDPTLYNWKNVGVPGEVAIQGYARGNRTHQFGNAGIGADNSLPVAELRFTLVIDLGTLDYPPIITDDLKTVHLTTEYPMGSDPDEVQQIEAEYDLPVETKEKVNESASKKRRASKNSKASNGSRVSSRGSG